MEHQTISAPSLYHVRRDHAHILAIIQSEDGEIGPAVAEALAVNDAEFETAAVSIAQVVRTAETSIAIVDAEIKRLQAIKKVMTERAETVSDQLAEAMQERGKISIDSPLLRVTTRKSQAVITTNEALIPRQYMVHKETWAPDRKAIAAAIKDGQLISGAHIETRTNLQIK